MQLPTSLTRPRVACAPRRQANWKLDPPLRKACKRDVLTMCATEDAANSEEGLVYKCLVKNYETLSEGCGKEVGRAVHMAFFVWQPEAIITAPCDNDIERLCLAERPNMASRPGAVGTCLATLVRPRAGLRGRAARGRCAGKAEPVWGWPAGSRAWMCSTGRASWGRAACE